MTSEAAALTEQERDAINEACLRDGKRFSGAHPDRAHVNTVVESILAARLADSRPVVSEAAIEAAVKAMVQESNQFKPASYDRMARAALTAALPHMSDGRGEA